MQLNLNQQFFTTTEVMNLLKIGYFPLLRRLKSGKIKAFRVGQRWRIPEEELKRYLESKANE